MLAESYLALRALPRVFRILRPPIVGTKRSFFTVIHNYLVFFVNDAVGNLGTSRAYSCSLSPKGTSKSLSSLSNEKPEEQMRQSIDNFRFRYPEFLPKLNVKKRNPMKEKLERREMLKRRSVINIPAFYVGSIMAVTTSNKHAPGKTTRFVGICIAKKNNGLDSTFLLRNVIDHHGVEVRYFLYSPLIQKIEVLRLEKRLDDELFYLRDAPNKYSTFPFDMQPQYHSNKNVVPINMLQVKLNPRPWLQRYERMDLKGVILPEISEKLIKKAQKQAKPWEKYDLVDAYRKTVPEEDQLDIIAEVGNELCQQELNQKVEKTKKDFAKPPRQNLF